MLPDYLYCDQTALRRRAEKCRSLTPPLFPAGGYEFPSWLTGEARRLRSFSLEPPPWKITPWNDVIQRSEGTRERFLEIVSRIPKPPPLPEECPPSPYGFAPFSMRLQMGTPQLTFYPFELSVMERYHRDARFLYTYDDLTGTIFERRDGAADDLLLENFGFAYDARGHRAIAVFLKFLAQLPPEDQRFWESKLMTESDFALHPVYYPAAILGEPRTSISIFDALLEEIHAINELCTVIGLPHLFWDEYPGTSRPPGLRFLVRPTAHQYSAFMGDLDDVMAGNINRHFFHSMIAEGEKPIDDSLSTVQLLDAWLRGHFKPDDNRSMEGMVMTFFEIERQRNDPWYPDNDVLYEQRFVKMQRVAMMHAYEAMRILRTIFLQHPAAAEYAVPESLRGVIWTK